MALVVLVAASVLVTPIGACGIDDDDDDDDDDYRKQPQISPARR